MAYHLGLAAAVAAPRLAIVASAAAGDPTRRIRRRTQPPPPAPPQPSVAEVRRAIGVAADPAEEKSSAFMELIAATPIGQPEGPAERRLREAAEWVVDTTEARACEVYSSRRKKCENWFSLEVIQGRMRYCSIGVSW